MAFVISLNAKVPAVAPATIEPHLIMTRPLVINQFCITYEVDFGVNIHVYEFHTNR